MKRMAWLGMASMAVLMSAAPAAGADKAHQLLMAEIRMLQEQQQQLHQLVGGLADTLKTMTAKLDEQTGGNRKAFADQKLLVDNVGEGVRILREKADDTNVRLASMTQELETMRQAIASMPAPSPAAPVTVDPATGAPVPGAAPPAAPSSTPPPNVSHQRVYDQSYADYTGGQYDLAITGFESYIRSYPTSPLADDAQLNIGNSYYGLGRYKEASAALQKLIADYPQADTLSTAYYKLGQTYERLTQLDLARKAYETVIQRFPNAFEATLAQ